MFYTIKMDDLSAFYGEPVEALKERPYRELEEMEQAMISQKAADESKRNAEDAEFLRIVKKYFTPYEFLAKYFPEKDILESCAKYLGQRDIVTKHEVRAGNRCYGPAAEYLGEQKGYMPVYYHGHELAEREWCKVDVYRVKNPYQGVHHGKVVLDLLYKKYPELQKYGFEAYAVDSGTDRYEIYPKGDLKHIYVPFRALMEKDIEAIKKRNLDYAKSYCHGEYTPDKAKERLESEPVKEFFSTILQMEPAKEAI